LLENELHAILLDTTVACNKVATCDGTFKLLVACQLVTFRLLVASEPVTFRLLVAREPVTYIG